MYSVKQGLLLTSLILSMSLCFNATANDVRYRFKNEQGNPVIANSIPPHLVQNGYEIIDRSSNVIKVVPPAPSANDVDKANRERAILSKYEVLKRRYSEVSDIERAKNRKLESINTNISILNVNITNLESAIAGLINQAAEQERAGRKVTESILTRLSDTKAELKISEDLLEYREEEYREKAKKYDDDIRAFIQGEALYKKQNPVESY